MLRENPALATENPTGSPPLEWAAWGDRADVAALLLRYGARPREAATCYGAAIKVNGLATLRLLLDHTESAAELINARRLLHLAVSMANTHENAALVRVLLDRGADPAQRDERERTPLELAHELRRNPKDPYGHADAEAVAIWLDAVMAVLTRP